MSGLDHPVLRAAMIFFAAAGLTQLWITISGLLPGQAQWFPWGVFPSFGSPQYIATYVASLFIFGAIDWLRFRGTARKELLQQGIIQQR